MEKFVEVYVAPDITYAYLIRAQLENADIPAQIANENLSGAYSIDGMAPRVLVPESKLKEAREIVEQTQEAVAEDSDDLDEEEPEDGESNDGEPMTED